MARKVKYGKIAIVIFLTALIWVWADLAQERQFSIPTVTIKMAGSINPALLAAFKDEQGSPVSSVPVYNVELRGPASNIAEVERMRNKGTLEREFFFDPEGKGMTQPGEHRMDVLSFLKQNKQIEDLGVTVEACEPPSLTVSVQQLVKKSLTVRCFDENGLLRQEASISPVEVDAFVPADQTPVAKVRLTPSEIVQARRSAIKKTPCVDLPGGQTRDALTGVQVKMPPAQDALTEYSIVGAKPGIALSLNLLGRYKVEVENLSEVIGTIRIRGTSAAKQAYESMRYQVILEIDDKDIDYIDSKDPLIKRPVVYNFPQEFVQRDEIVLNQDPVIARFKLVSVSAGEL